MSQIQAIVDGLLVPLTQDEIAAIRGEQIRLGTLPSDATDSEKIKSACTMIEDYQNVTSADLATKITEKKFIKPMSVTDFFIALKMLGADTNEFKPIWGYEKYFNRLEDGLTHGRKVSVLALIETAPFPLSSATITFAQQVVTNNQKSIIDVICEYAKLSVPTTIDSNAVDVALERSV